MCAVEDVTGDELADVAGGAYPFADCSRAVLENVLDMLAGRYPSDEFAELRPRIVWDRATDTLRARPGARMLAVTSGGTIPDRGLYGVFTPEGSRVGELDEEMVYESRVGETFVLGATTWRIEEITRDRVIVTPAPGEPGKVPFWHGDRPGRPLELGRAVGRFTREVLESERPPLPGLDTLAARNLVAYVRDQAEATGAVPDDRTGAAPPPADAGQPYAVVAAAPAGRGPARRRQPAPDVPDRPRGDPGVPAGPLRPPRAAPGAGRRPGPACPPGGRRHVPPVAVRPVAGVLLGRHLHVRGRRAAGGAAGGRPRPRPGSAPRPARRRGAAGSDRRRRPRRAGGGTVAAAGRAAGGLCRRGPRPAAAAGRPHRGGDRRADRRRRDGGGAVGRGTGGRAAGRPGAGGRRRAGGGRRGRGPAA